MKVRPANRFYVYVLIDPRDRTVFYVGKGTKRRISDHVRKVRQGQSDNIAKCLRISEILREGLEVIEEKVAEGMTEANALDLERQLIASYAYLTNQTTGTMTYSEKSKQRARFMLLNLKSYDDWLRNVGAIEIVKKMGYAPAAFYEKFKTELENLAQNGQQEWYEVTSGPCF